MGRRSEIGGYESVALDLRASLSPWTAELQLGIPFI